MKGSVFFARYAIAAPETHIIPAPRLAPCCTVRPPERGSVSDIAVMQKVKMRFYWTTTLQIPLRFLKPIAPHAAGWQRVKRINIVFARCRVYK